MLSTSRVGESFLAGKLKPPTRHGRPTLSPDHSLPNNLAELREQQEKSLAPVKAEILKDFEKFRFENVEHFFKLKFF